MEAKVITMNVIRKGMSLWLVDDMMNLCLMKVVNSKTGVTGRLIVEFEDGCVAMFKETLTEGKSVEAAIVTRNDTQYTGFTAADRKGAEAAVYRMYNKLCIRQEAIIESAQLAIEDLTGHKDEVIRWLDSCDVTDYININENTDE